MKYPTLPVGSSSREMVDVFKGYNHNLRISDGEFYEMENMTSDHYPVLSPRERRGAVADINNLSSAALPREGKLTGVTHTDRWGVMYTQGPNMYTLVAVNSPIELGLNDEPKRFVLMGAYLIVLPDMKYVNLNNLQDCGGLGHSVEVNAGEVTCKLCKVDGELYEGVTTSATAPENPKNMALWLDTSASPHVLKQYAETTNTWTSVAATYVKISGLNYGTDGSWFNQYDGVTISGLVGGASQLNGAAVLQTNSNTYSIVIAGILDESVTQDCAAYPIRIERKVPVLDYVIEAGNRLWGCRYGKSADGTFVNEIYASKLGDCKNWNCFMGIATDSWAASVGSPGPFTGAANIGGYPVFYKENMKHKVWPSETGAHQITNTPCRGVARNCGGSIATIDGTAIYRSDRGFCIDDGSMPVEIGQCFGGAEYSGAIGCACGRKYYVSMQAAEEWHLFVYDAEKQLWHREDDFHAISMDSGSNQFLMAVEAEGNKIIDMSSGTDRGKDRMEGPVSWMVESGDLGLSLPDQKYISRLTIRMSLDIGAEVSFYGQYDHEDKWLELGSVHGSSLRSFSLPVRPRRCDHLRLKICGTGMGKIYSITKTIEQGGELS